MGSKFSREMLQCTISVVVGAAVIGILGFCVYFDRKRHNGKKFKKKLRENGQKAKQTGIKVGDPRGFTQIPDIRDTEAMRQYFRQEVQLGEELLAIGDIGNGVDHLSNAVAVSANPDKLLESFHRVLSTQVFELVLQRIPQAGERLRSAVSRQLAVRSASSASTSSSLRERRPGTSSVTLDSDLD